jgi:hypothetical protein
MIPSTSMSPDAAQADALAHLVELEACWANVPLPVVKDSATASLASLVAKQKAFDAYHAHMVAYNQRYRPAYHDLRPICTAVRLAPWCRWMADLYARAGQTECPVQLLEQAHRNVDRLGSRLNRDLVCRPTHVMRTADAIAGLRAIAKWCDGLMPSVADEPLRPLNGIAS